MFKVKVEEDLIIHKINPQILSTTYTKTTYLFGAKVHTKISIVNTSFDESIFDKQVDKEKGMGFKRK